MYNVSTILDIPWQSVTETVLETHCFLFDHLRFVWIRLLLYNYVSFMYFSFLLIRLCSSVFYTVKKKEKNPLLLQHCQDVSDKVWKTLIVPVLEFYNFDFRHHWTRRLRVGVHELYIHSPRNKDSLTLFDQYIIIYDGRRSAWLFFFYCSNFHIGQYFNTCDFFFFVSKEKYLRNYIIYDNI